jgi:hypothetical protein
MEADLLRQSRLRRWARVVLPLAAGLALRLWMLKVVFEVAGDGLLYGALAKNLLLHGRYAFSGSGGALIPTLIRLPGYPLFLALCFRLFGMENYYAACCVQIALDLGGCLLLADFARRIAPPALGSRAELATLWLAALCPFTASYTALPLTETLTLFTLSLALWAMARFREDPGWNNALWFTIAVCACAFLRPDGALAAVAFAPALVIARPPNKITRARLLRMACVCTVLALTPFAAWTIRNGKTFHVFEPLVPRLANDPGEPAHPGWERWVKTWCLDFISTYQIYWNVPGNAFAVPDLPLRAFDSPAQQAETTALANDYEDNGEDFSPGLDARFAALARARAAAHPLRYYLWLPLGRLADMALRPRVDNLPIDLDWWVYAHHHAETEFGWAYAALNALYLALGVAGLCLRPRFAWALLAYMLLRGVVLALTVAAPETRYTLEWFPPLFALGGVAAAAAAHRFGWSQSRLRR